VTSTPPPESSPAPIEEEGVPAGFAAKAVLTAAPFVLAALVYLALRWLT
jgi:hypothetical protein